MSSSSISTALASSRAEQRLSHGQHWADAQPPLAQVPDADLTSTSEATLQCKPFKCNLNTAYNITIRRINNPWVTSSLYKLPSSPGYSCLIYTSFLVFFPQLLSFNGSKIMLCQTLTQFYEGFACVALVKFAWPSFIIWGTNCTALTRLNRLRCICLLISHFIYNTICITHLHEKCNDLIPQFTAETPTLCGLYKS